MDGKKLEGEQIVVEHAGIKKRSKINRTKETQKRYKARKRPSGKRQMLQLW